MDFRSSSELDHRDPTPSRQLPGKSDDASSPGLCMPYDTVSNRRIRLPPTDPSADAYHVRGLTTPFVTPTTGPPGTTSAPERPWASPFKDFPSSRSVPLSGPVALLSLPRSAAPPRRAAPTARPASGPSSRDESVLSPEPRMVPAVDPFLGFRPPERAPVRPGARFGRGASPLALWRLDV
jgi:hypothetical protein